MGGANICAKYNNTDYDTRGGMGIEYVGPFGSSSQTGGLVYLAVGFETIYPESKRTELMEMILNLFNSQLVIDKPIASLTPLSLSIYRLYPNPANMSITLEFFSSAPRENTSIIVTDILGRVVKNITVTSVSQHQTWNWNGMDDQGLQVPTGLYIISIANDSQIKSRKLSILK